MQSLSIVVAHADNVAAQTLATNLQPHARKITFAKDGEDLRTAIARHRAQVAVVDLESVSVEAVREICNEFSGTAVVCVHRVPDEQMWTEAVDAGAVDCCPCNDTRSIISALKQVRTYSAAAAA